jgi:hypothetical protein
MEIKSILNRYKLAHRSLDVDDIEIGGGNNIEYLKLYYLYLPLVIGSIIILVGFIIDFNLFKVCGVPFLLYAVYGLGQINMAIRNNRNTTIISNGEIRISMNDVVTTLNSNYIKDYKIKMEPYDDTMYVGHLLIIDKENKQHLILRLIDDELSTLKDNLNFINDFIQFKMNATNTRLAKKPRS